MLGMHEYDGMPLGYLLHRVVAVLRPQVTTELRELGLGLPQFVRMRILSMSPGRSSAELARDTNVSPQAMDQLMRGLQDMGVVTRPATVSSGRARPAQLTAKGRALLKRAEAEVHVADEWILAPLTPAERREFKRFLHTVGARATLGVAPPCNPQTW